MSNPTDGKLTDGKSIVAFQMNKINGAHGSGVVANNETNETKESQRKRSRENFCIAALLVGGCDHLPE